MCGFLLTYDPQRPVAAMETSVGQAMAALTHRGPDESGIVSAGGAWIGHNRLSIIDVVGSHQPMRCPLDRYWLCYNGETYNYRQLRAALADRWQFRTEGDTEVVLAGLLTEGRRFLDRMEGLWAFALWDARDRKLMLCRDRFGKKPLYFIADERSIACGSELPALRSVTSGHSWREDVDSTADYFRYGFFMPGRTAYRDVLEVLPGHFLEWQPGKPVAQSRYWSLSPAAFTGHVSDARAAMRDKLEQAVQRRLVSDVDVGALLSGGVDSSIIVALTAPHKPTQLKTFTIGFADPAYDESAHARAIAARYSTSHFEERLEAWDQPMLDQLLLRHVGQPFADPSLLPTAMVARLAASEVKVALAGDGGDEVFSGYQRYQARVLLRWFARLPRPMRGAALSLIRALPEPMTHHSRSVLKKAHLFAQIASDAPDAAYVAPRLFSADQRRRLVPSLLDRGHRPPGLSPPAHVSDIGTMMFQDALIYLPQDILQKTDRASMAHSLEVRAPFLDREVTEFAFSLPSAWHRHRGTGKRLLQAATSDLLPSEVFRRRKQGFSVPTGSWFVGPAGERLAQMLQGVTGPVDPAAGQALLTEHRTGGVDHGLRLWALYVYLMCRSQGLYAAAA